MRRAKRKKPTCVWYAGGLSLDTYIKRADHATLVTT